MRRHYANSRSRAGRAPPSTQPREAMRVKSSDKRCLAIILMSAIVLAALFPAAAPAAGFGESRLSACRGNGQGEQGDRACIAPMAGLGRVPRSETVNSIESRCITEGLRSLPVSLTARVISQEAGRVNTPSAVVVWSGRPLPNSCGAHVSVSFDMRLWFQKLGGSPLDLGSGPNGWQVFWSGRGQVHRARKVYNGPTFSASIGCISKSRGWLRYRVVGDGGEVLAQRKQAVPVRHPSCH
jgi:hypothetical protein